MKRLILLSLLITSISISPVYAIDPGFAKGALQVGNETIPLTHVCAQLHDNAEGLLDRPREMRILIADREVRQESLDGPALLPLRAMAKEGSVRGLLITFDPNDRNNARVTFLFPPSDPAASLITQTRMSSDGVFKDLKISDLRVWGAIEEREPRESGFGDNMAPITYATSFSAPLFHEPKVTAVLKGQAIGNSPQVKVLRDAAAALRKADFEALRKLSTDRANRQTDLMLAQTGAQGVTLAQEAGEEMADSIAGIVRIVVRGDRAVVIFPGKSWKNLERVNGAWKIDE